MNATGSKRYVVFGTDCQTAFGFYTPLTCVWWREVADWTPLVFSVNRLHPEHDQLALNCARMWCPSAQIVTIDGDYTDSEIALYTRYLRHVAYLHPLLRTRDDDVIMTCDMDMWPLCRDWFEQGYDYTMNVLGSNAMIHLDRYYPICYQKATVRIWERFIDLVHPDFMQAAFDLCRAKWSTGHPEFWNDEACLSDLYKRMRVPLNLIPRPGARAGMMAGRVDRSRWCYYGPSEPGLIDAHLMRPGYSDENWPKLEALVRDFLPDWVDRFNDYRNQYRAMIAE